MAAIVYPSGLPCPQLAPYTPAERRVLQPRPAKARNVQRDRSAMVEVTLPPLTPAQAEAFYRWWLETLVFGGAWFYADWPMPWGRGGVFRFAATPNWALVKAAAADMRRISFPMEVRGRGLPPQKPEIDYGIFYVNFNTDLPLDLAPDPATAAYDEEAVVFDDGTFHSVSPFTANVVRWGPVEKFNAVADGAAWTMEAKFRWTTVANSVARMIFGLEFGTGIDRTNMLLHFYANLGEVRFTTSGGETIVGPTTTAADEHHMALVRPEGADPLYRLYVDEELVGSTHVTSQPVVSDDGINLYTGNTADQGSEDYRVDWLRLSLGEKYTGSTYNIPEDE